MTRRVVVRTDLPAGAAVVWRAMQRTSTLAYLCRGVLGLPDLNRYGPVIVPDTEAVTRLRLFHLIPLHRHTIRVLRVDDRAREIETEEHGGPLRSWHHVLQVEPGPGHGSRYTDTVDVDAGRLTPLAVGVVHAFYRYRQYRWRRLASRLSVPM